MTTGTKSVERDLSISVQTAEMIKWQLQQLLSERSCKKLISSIVTDFLLFLLLAWKKEEEEKYIYMYF